MSKVSGVGSRAPGFEILTRSPHLLFCKRVGNGANKQMHRRRLSGSRLQDERGHLLRIARLFPVQAIEMKIE